MVEWQEGRTGGGGQGERSGGRHLMPREKMMFGLREKVLFHAPLSQFRVPRMKIQTPPPPGDERSSWGLCPAQEVLEVEGTG